VLINYPKKIFFLSKSYIFVPIQSLTFCFAIASLLRRFDNLLVFGMVVKHLTKHYFDNFL